MSLHKAENGKTNNHKLYNKYHTIQRKLTLCTIAKLFSNCLDDYDDNNNNKKIKRKKSNEQNMSKKLEELEDRQVKWNIWKKNNKFSFKIIEYLKMKREKLMS